MVKQLEQVVLVVADPPTPQQRQVLEILHQLHLHKEILGELDSLLDHIQVVVVVVLRQDHLVLEEMHHHPLLAQVVLDLQYPLREHQQLMLAVVAVEGII